MVAPSVVDRLPIILLHGYSASQGSFRRWRDVLVERGYEATAIHLGDYVSLSNEITIKDIAEGLDRALREEVGLSADEPFDAIVHSTGGLVIREWLATYGVRRRRLKRLVALAPAMFGSPLAHKGQSWLAAVFKGERQLGPDFMETGHLVLLGLELASRYTWDLAHRDLLRDEPIYDESPDSPYPFVFIGLSDYGPLKRLLVGDPGSDGTVRWAGAGLNTREIVVDLTREPGAKERGRFDVRDWHNIDAPLVLIPGLNHGTIVSEPPEELVDMVVDALGVEDMAGYRAWGEKHSTMAAGRLDGVRADRWQQFLVRVVDERGDPVPDYYVELVEDDEILEDFSKDVHPFTLDESLRCFHVNLSKLKPETRKSPITERARRPSRARAFPSRNPATRRGTRAST
jgi:pimeloyl-ACP methyl ester carboxylesterase